MQGGGEDGPPPAKRRALAGADGATEHVLAELGLGLEIDEELDDKGIPTGWRECPPMGDPVDRFIPM